MDIKQPIAPLRVLLADDDTDDCQFFGKALKELPIETHLTVITDGERLIDYLLKNVEQLPDILFLDLSMPRKTGFECLAEIRENEKLKDIPVVVFTISYPYNPEFEKEITKTLSSMGAQNYICKSPDLTKLKQAINHSILLLTEKRSSTLQIEKTE